MPLGPKTPLTISVVSHGHGRLVAQLLSDIARVTPNCSIIITVNLPEAAITVPPTLSKQIRWRINEHPRGFGANHNAAFESCTTPFFCVINPDVRWNSDPLPPLFAAMEDPSVGLAAPAVVGTDGSLEDSVRRFPTVLGLISKFFGAGDGRHDFAPGNPLMPADWVGGMFMLFRSSAFAAVGGFDEKFFLYYEDVDICARLWRAGYRVMACPAASVIHAAQRTSRHDWRYRRWHAQSMLRYFAKHWLRLPRPSGPDSR